MDKGQRNAERETKKRVSRVNATHERKQREKERRENGKRERGKGGPVKRAKHMNRVQEHPRAGRLAIQCKLADFSELRHYSSNVNTAI